MPPLFVDDKLIVLFKSSLSAALLMVFTPSANAQDTNKLVLPPVEVEQPKTGSQSQSPKTQNKIQTSKTQTQDFNPTYSETETGEKIETSKRNDPYAVVPPGTRSGSLGVATPAEARADINRLPGGVEVVPSEEYSKDTPAITLKDALDYVPGVYVQTKWGEDSRLSIRGSGLSRNFHLRGI
ncbi:MAG: TonB-dependent receptor plug domain-containing protein, partial [Hyphomicrobium sp.]